MGQRCFEKNMAGLKPPRSIMNTSGRSISRILSNGLRHLCNHLSGQRVAALLGAAYRGWLLPRLEGARAETSSLPSSTDDFAPAWPCSRRGLPGRLHYCKRRWSLTPPFHHHRPPVRAGQLFVSVALFRQVHASRRFPVPGAIRRRALWSADFPRSRQRRTAIARST